MIPCCNSMSCASRETVFSTNKMFGRKETTLATKFFKNSNSWRTSGSRDARRFSFRCKKRNSKNKKPIYKIFDLIGIEMKFDPMKCKCSLLTTCSFPEHETTRCIPTSPEIGCT